MIRPLMLPIMEQVAGGQQAAMKIQTAAKGMLDRMHAARAAEQELLFLGMKQQVEGPLLTSLDIFIIIMLHRQAVQCRP